MKSYLSLLSDVLASGTDRANRTGTPTRSLFGAMMQFDLREGFPAVTTKKLAFRNVVAELLGFLRGYDNAAQFRELGTRIWDIDANDNIDWLRSPWRVGQDDLGRIYGQQWRRWKTDAPILGEPTETCPECGGIGKLNDAEPGDIGRNEWDCTECSGTGKSSIAPIVGYQPFDQLADVIHRIKTDPYDRRLIVSAWNPWEVHDQRMALPPCHVMFQFYVRPFSARPVPDTSLPPGISKGYLDLAMYQRSADLFLGVPFNIASYSLLLSMVAKVTGYLPGRFTHFLGDAHIYHNHFDQAREQLRRKPYLLPHLWLHPQVTEIDDFAPEDIRLEGYTHHDAIKAHMSTKRS